MRRRSGPVNRVPSVVAARHPRGRPRPFRGHFGAVPKVMRFFSRPQERKLTFHRNTPFRLGPRLGPTWAHEHWTGPNSAPTIAAIPPRARRAGEEGNPVGVDRCERRAGLCAEPRVARRARAGGRRRRAAARRRAALRAGRGGGRRPGRLRPGGRHLGPAPLGPPPGHVRRRPLARPPGGMAGGARRHTGCRRRRRRGRPGRAPSGPGRPPLRRRIRAHLVRGVDPVGRRPPGPHAHPPPARPLVAAGRQLPRHPPAARRGAHHPPPAGPFPRRCRAPARPPRRRHRPRPGGRGGGSSSGSHRRPHGPGRRRRQGRLRHPPGGGAGRGAVPGRRLVRPLRRLPVLRVGLATPACPFCHAAATVAEAVGHRS